MGAFSLPAHIDGVYIFKINKVEPLKYPSNLDCYPIDICVLYLWLPQPLELCTFWPLK